MSNMTIIIYEVIEIFIQVLLVTRIILHLFSFDFHLIFQLSKSTKTFEKNHNCITSYIL